MTSGRLLNRSELEFFKFINVNYNTFLFQIYISGLKFSFGVWIPRGKAGWDELGDWD